MTVAAEILQAPIFEHAKVRAGTSFLAQNYIEWISVMELPVENFVRENEFVLTTGIGCHGDYVLLEQFVRDVIDSGASMLGIATGRFIFTIPDSILTLANEHEFIIVEIPWEVRFGDAIQAVLHVINHQKRSEREESERIRRQFINIVLQTTDVQAICELLHDHTSLSPIIIDNKETVRAHIKSNPPVLSVNDLPLAESESPISDHPLYPYIESYNYQDTVYSTIQIEASHRKLGYIWFPHPSSTLSWFHLTILEHALTACALFFVQEDAVETAEIRLKDTFLLELARGIVTEDSTLSSKAQKLGYDLNLTYLCIVGDIHLRKKVGDFPSFKQDSPTTSSLQNVNYYIQREVANAAQFLSKRVMVTFDEGEVIIYLETDHHLLAESANQFLDTVDRRLNELLTEVGLNWGIAAKRDSFKQSYVEAKAALDIGLRSSVERTFYKDTRIKRLLLTMLDKPEVFDVMEDTIQPLLDYDAKRQTDLVHTFMMYNKHNGNVSQTARELHLHRQSLLYRLRNIESLTQLSLVDADDVFLLELCIRLSMLKNGVDHD
ncbi:PucR family transcriptional regulator ligand-binding domain-containing protein [Paenalkalicoccus suaedae]|uniref:PucR family transcriptional regulator ligand-binding domain-containing protein n=1 Tax=Paenalkalicoccus suaedae TaxID=2592382 RepID=A0A859FH78_9BACI|nr:PucR family transcriptional regulator [Paenalkalicoccus suaedae]QKS72150.1 PucR family transcriptional regulator ligand-binding domain-containing protein [Paenalkalicoccus suaedae]